MTNEQILRLAKQAGLHHRYDSEQDISYVTNQELFEQEKHANDEKLVKILADFANLIEQEILNGK